MWQALLDDFINDGARIGNGHTQKLNETAIWCTSCGAFEGPYGASTKGTFANDCRGNPRTWAGPLRRKQLERLRQGIHPTWDIPLGPEVTCKSGAGSADHMRLTTEQVARRRAWDKATKRKATRKRCRGRVPTRTTVDDGFFTEALSRFDGRNPIYATDNELTKLRGQKSSLAHVDADIEQLEETAKESNGELFLLPSSTLDNVGDDLLDLRIIAGKLVNPFAGETSESCKREGDD